ncbi:NUDIX hydrolase [Frankia sp. QA3]|uniref:NUDIX hydrolase n=1 Tax=Frankia sp. QA3 TaxID=710111 RepID=UPI000269CBD5|nr:NUDIX domain-containing protein [Frankia sp. QA3]EIV95518.1 ADP-ribose pyrophosphatase [Frankia sp. QA3]
MTPSARPSAPASTASTASGPALDPTEPAAAPVRINVRALLVEGDRILLANERGQTWFHLPGGQVDAGETVQGALRRLLDEQAGIEPDHLAFAGCIEGSATERDERVGVLDVVFAADRSRAAEFGSRLDDLDIVSVSLASLPDLQLRPATLRQLIPEWLLHARPAWYGASGR